VKIARVFVPITAAITRIFLTLLRQSRENFVGGFRTFAPDLRGVFLVSLFAMAKHYYRQSRRRKTSRLMNARYLELRDDAQAWAGSQREAWQATKRLFEVITSRRPETA
jgi:hypothetical protein